MDFRSRMPSLSSSWMLSLGFFMLERGFLLIPALGRESCSDLCLDRPRSAYLREDMMTPGRKRTGRVVNAPALGEETADEAVDFIHEEKTAEKCSVYVTKTPEMCGVFQ
uniref:Uncharacterized protein LOC109504902 n=1 Tax=Elaeis guineensis var. tenera TaxID=51953 RepID=A0A8N4I5J9_ELAGV|nr:uncharacterized protein LOC109504902 [Elaeis guineensis]